eukprot:g56154.t1
MRGRSAEAGERAAHATDKASQRPENKSILARTAPKARDEPKLHLRIEAHEHVRRLLCACAAELKPVFGTVFLRKDESKAADYGAGSDGSPASLTLQNFSAEELNIDFQYPEDAAALARAPWRLSLEPPARETHVAGARLSELVVPVSPGARQASLRLCDCLLGNNFIVMTRGVAGQNAVVKKLRFINCDFQNQATAYGRQILITRTVPNSSFTMKNRNHSPMDM